LIFYHFS